MSVLEFDIILDSSQQNLKEVPKQVLQMFNLRMLYLQENFIKELPKDFFPKLPHLCWLDLRNNHLTEIPENIAHHQNLENLLLSDNKIQALPISLGVVPKLKVLQIADNPLVFPCRKIISEGTKSICTYLKSQYDKVMCPSKELEEKEESQDQIEIKSEKEVRVNDYGSEFIPLQESVPSLTVKSLSKTTATDTGIIHKVSAGPKNKIFLRSYYDEDVSTQSSSFNVPSGKSVKEAWTDKIRVLLMEQEKILQQERSNIYQKLRLIAKTGLYRNLRALNSWRHEKKIEPDRSANCKFSVQPPYGTQPEYESLLTREEMRKQIDRTIQHGEPPEEPDIEKLISDLVSQMKEMETSYDNTGSNQMALGVTSSHIMKIVEMHKKLLKLQQKNDSILQ